MIFLQAQNVRWLIDLLFNLIRMYNIRAKKQLSQNFIMDPRLLRRIAEVLVYN